MSETILPQAHQFGIDKNMLLVKVEDKTERGIQPNDSFVKQGKEQLNEYGK